MDDEQTTVNLVSGLNSFRGGVLKRLSKYLPSMSDVLSGFVVLLFGLLMLSKGAIFVQSSPGKELVDVGIPSDLPTWMSWFIVWIGFDIMVSGGKITDFILSKTVKPVRDAVVKNIRGERR